MKKSDYILRGFMQAAGVFIYVACVAWLMFNGKGIFGDEDNFLLPVLMLLLFIVSASITGALVLGKPIVLYLEGHKKEGLTLLFATLLWLITFLIGVVVILIATAH